MSPQSVPTTNLEVKNGVNCEHSPVDLSKVSRDMGSWLIGLRTSLVEPRVQLLEATKALLFQHPFSKTRALSVEKEDHLLMSSPFYTSLDGANLSVCSTRFNMLKLRLIMDNPS